MSTHWHNNKNNYNRRSINSWFNSQPSHSTTARVEELGDRDTPIFLHPPPLHQPSWDATIMDTVGDEDAEEAVDHSFFRGAIHPPPMSITTGRNASTAPHTPGGRGYFTSTAPYTPGGRGYFAPMHQAHINVPYSNTTKRHANWNACFSCGFDMDDNHTSQTCPLHLRRHNHNVNFTRCNAQQYINAGYRCCTKNCHKTVFPQL
jgi:hypothetical protein